MIEVKKTPIDSEGYEELKALDFFQTKDFAKMLDDVCHMENVELYLAVSDKIYGFLLISMATKDAISILNLSIIADFGQEDVRKALLDYVLEDKKPKALVGEVTEDCIDFYEKYGFYVTEIGENLPGKEAYYVTYRNVKR